MGKKILSTKINLGAMSGTMPITRGGTNSTSTDDAAINLNGIDYDRRNMPNGVVGLDENTQISLSVLPSALQTNTVFLYGPKTASINSINNSYQITNYSRFFSYNITVDAGSASLNVETGVITFNAPNTIQVVTMSVNGTIYNIEITPITDYISTPSIITPVHGSIDLGPNVTFSSTAFIMGEGSDTHEGSDWQLSTDNTFTSIVSSVTNSATNKTSWSVAGLAANTTFYVRVRHKGTSLGYSNWSSIASFSTKVSYLPTTELAKLVANDPIQYSNFGRSVAISDTGEYMVIGSHLHDVSYNDRGAVYIFIKSGSGWTQQARITAPDLDSYFEYMFGKSVDISANGDYIVVGAGDRQTNQGYYGGVYVYIRSGSTWSFQQVMRGVYEYGHSVAISGNGNYIITTGGLNRSNAQIYVRSGSTWSLQKTIAVYGMDNLNAGPSIVDISSNGSYVVIGARLASPSSGTNVGSAYVYQRSGASWDLAATLSASDGAANDNFGISVSISADNKYIAVGANGDDIGSNSDQGSVYIFVNNDGIWSQQAKLVASDGLAGDTLGETVAISADGSYVVSGADNAKIGINANQGAAYIFTRSGSTWTQQAKLVASDGTVNHIFSWSDVDISNDGKYIVVGAGVCDIAGRPDQGAVYVFG